MATEYLEEKKELAAVMARLCKSGLTTSTGGNASIRVEDGCLITPSGLDKLALTPSDIIHIPDSGSTHAGQDSTSLPEGGGAQPSMEAGMHLAVYASRPDLSAVIHAHPLFATSYSATGREIRFDLTGESRVLLGRVERVRFELMGTERLAASVAEAFSKAETVILGNHGAAAGGDSLGLAFSRIETLETAARVSFITHLLGERRPLSQDDLKKIDALFGGGHS